MKDLPSATRRRVLRAGAALGATGLGLGAVGTAAANPGKGDEKGDGKQFGRVYANDVLWRTNVVTVLDERPDPEDRIYFLHDGEKPIAARDDVSSEVQESPFVSESAPGDRDWNGGKWTHFSAEVTDVGAFNEDAPLTNDAEVLGKDYIDVTLGRPGFGPPNYFICPLNGRA
ncbi:MAG: hypothetical protein ABEH78_00295 [Haloferacaceae archaeon]